jgi:regulator of sigma D
VITEAKKQAITERALAQLRERKEPVRFELDITLVLGLIGQFQLAFRHPGNVGPSRDALEKFVRELIEQLDPGHGDVYALLMMGFDERYDE